MTERDVAASTADDAPPATGSAPGATPDRARELGVGLGVVAASVLFYVVWGVVFYGAALLAVGGPLTEAQESMVDPPALAFGIFTATAIYLVHSRHDASFLDLPRPDWRHALWIVGGVAALIGLNYAVGYLYTLLDVPLPEHGTVEIVAAADPLVVAYFVVVSVLLIGPSEELLFRNVLQKRLAESFSWVGAVLASSVVFALVHTAAYFTADPIQVLGALVTVFLLSLVLGYVYERTASLPVVALIHGVYDAVLFSLVYFGVGI